ncbi:hypothetical protein ABPG74_007983 [Tetrahymena malaccensis]
MYSSIPNMKENCQIVESLSSILKQKCTLHPKRVISMLCFEDGQNQFLKCQECTQSNSTDYILISDLLESSTDTLIQGYPIQQKSHIFTNLTEINSRINKIEDLSTQIKGFFKNLSFQVNQILQEKEEQIIQNMQQMLTENKMAILKHNQFSFQEELKEVLQQKNCNLEKRNIQLGVLITKMNELQEQNQRSLQEYIQKINQFDITFDFKQNKQIQMSILELIEQIELIQSENVLSIKEPQQAEASQDLTKFNITDQQKIVIDMCQVKSKDINDTIKEIKQYPPITDLSIDLQKNKLYLPDCYSQQKGLQYSEICNISQSIKNCKYLQTLQINLNQNLITQNDMIELSSGLQSLSDLKQLDLKLQSCQINENGIKSLTQMLDTKNLTHLSLDLSNNNITKQGAKYISQFLEKCIQLTNLNLDLSSCNINQESAIKLGVFLNKNQKITDFNLNLQDNSIGSQGLETILFGLQNQKQISSLTLNLDKNNIKNLVIYLAILLKKQQQNLIYLDLNFASFQFNTNDLNILQERLKCLQKLWYLKLDLRGTEFKDCSFFELQSEELKNISSLHLLLNKNITEKIFSNIYKNIETRNINDLTIQDDSKILHKNNGLSSLKYQQTAQQLTVCRWKNSKCEEQYIFEEAKNIHNLEIKVEKVEIPSINFEKYSTFFQNNSNLINLKLHFFDSGKMILNLENNRNLQNIDIYFKNSGLNIFNLNKLKFLNSFKLDIHCTIEGDIDVVQYENFLNLKTFYLSDIFKAEKFVKMLNGLSKAQNLIELNISFYTITQETILIIIDILKNLINLIKLRINFDYSFKIPKTLLLQNIKNHQKLQIFQLLTRCQEFNQKDLQEVSETLINFKNLNYLQLYPIKSNTQCLLKHLKLVQLNTSNS